MKCSVLIFISILASICPVFSNSALAQSDPCAVTTFGADGSDAVDDTEALQAAAIACNGKQIRVPPGTYIFTEEVPIASNTMWVGEGSGNSVMQYAPGLDQLPPPFPKFIRATAEFGYGPIENITVRDLGFDMNGNDFSFGGFITIENGTNILIENCRFFDSNAPLQVETVGTGNGVQTSFTYTLNTVGDKQPLSKTIVVTDGTQTATDTGEGFFTGNVSGGGSVTYNRSAAITVPFASPPASGATVSVSYRSVVQRQYLVLVRCSNVRVLHNTLTQGGRILSGRPGADTFITGNVIEDANDNAITIANVSGQTSRRVLIANNIIKNASTASIYFGADGAEVGVVYDEILIVNNVIMGSNDNSGILGRLGASVLGGITISGNAIRAFGSNQMNHAISLISGEPGITGGKVIVSNNTIEGNFSHTGITVNSTQKINVLGNIMNFTTPGVTGVSLTESSNVTVALNEIHGAGVGVLFQPAGTSTFSNVKVNSNSLVGGAGVVFNAGVIVTKSRVFGNYIEGTSYGIKNNSGNALDVSIVNNELTNNALGSFVNLSGSIAATAEVQGLTLTFAQLAGVPARSGSTAYCFDCTRASPTAGGGTGARLRREAGVWNGD